VKLAPLLASSLPDELDRLAKEHVRTDEKLGHAQLCNFLESAILSYRFVHDFLINRQPPTFAFLTLLLDAPGFELSLSGFKEAVTAETIRISTLIDSGDLLARDNQLRLYRSALAEARKNDADVNSSESAILAALRRESDIAQVEHFLIEHHSDFRQFWDKLDAFEHEQNALRSAGMVFLREGKVLIPEDVVPAISQSLGIDMPSDSLRRLLALVSNQDLANALGWSGSRTSGTKTERLERVLLERIQPRVILRAIDLETLRNICRDTGAPIAGRKDELVERIVEHFSQRRDQVPEEIPEPPRVEPRTLPLERFQTLFSQLHNQELSDILRRSPDLRQSGSKDQRIETLWEAHLSEETFLGELMSRDLENVLYRLGLKLGGSKSERILRVINHFSEGVAVGEGPSIETRVPPPVGNEGLRPEYPALQDWFRQRASNPTGSLQPWLKEVLKAPGLVRCYATEDENPTKQLKNKLSQAASAKDGLLVLLLADQAAFDKAREALVERWMTNDEWSKNVACVALACPLGDAAIHSIIEGRDSHWPKGLRGIFPNAEVVSARGRAVTAPRCAQCGESLPAAARFCPNCGARSA
jgi:uncharacterized protein (DUF2267 family)